LAGGLGVDGAQRHAPTGDDLEAEERDLLEGESLAALLAVVRVEVRLLDQVRRQRLDPLRLDAGHGSRVELGGLDQFAGDNPARALLEEAGTGEDVELAGAWAGVLEGIS